MRLTQIDLNLFLVFDAIYSEGNLTRAAETLSVTQPAVSNALSRLRTALGDPLFVRSPQGMTPTAHAESIASVVTEALHLLSGAAQRGAGFDPQRSNRVFRLSMPDLFDALLLAPLVADTASLAPGIGLQNFRLARADIRGALTRGMLDVAAEVALPDSTGLHRAPLLSEPHVCALRPGHPALAEPLTLGGYLDLDHIHVSGRKRGSGVVDLALRSLGVQRSIRIRLQHYLSVGELVLGSDLAVSLPRSWARTLGLIAQPLPFEVPKMETFLYRHTRSDGDAAVCWLFDRILARPPTGHSRKDQ